jgi:site-specific DNA-methyltransferase (adenine-specific)
MYIVSGYTHLREILNVLHDTDLHLVSSLVWKYNFGVYATKKWINSHYHILMVAKDPKKIKYYPFQRYPEKYRDKSDKSLNYADRESVWEIKREYWKGCLKTPTRLPYDLIEKMLVYSSDEGDLVLDPFMGSGQTAFVAKDLKRKYIGSEIVEEYCKFANKRVDSGQYLIPNIIIPDIDIPKEELTWLKKLTKKLTNTTEKKKK